MKRALFLAFDMLPGAPVGAALRTAEFVRLLPEHGWTAKVICGRGGGDEAADPTGSPLRVEAPSALVGSDQLTAWAWSRAVRGPARRLMQEERHDLIYVSCPPFPHSLSAAALSRTQGLPLVVDLRDSWSLDPHASGGRLKRGLKAVLCASLYRWSERRVLGSAEAVITNTPSMRRAYARAFRVDEQGFDLIPNGFSEEDFCESIETGRSATPRVVHCGRFRAVAGRSPWLLLRAVGRLQAAGRRLDLRLVGESDPTLLEKARREGLADGVQVIPALPHAEAIAEMRRSQVVVIYQEPGRGLVTPVAGKTYEAIRSGRPILGLVPEGDNADLLRRHAGRVEIVTSYRVDDVVAALGRLLDGPQDDSPPDRQFLERFERRALCRRLAAVFDRVVGEGSRGA